MPLPTIRIGFGLVPGDPFWVQVREAVQQRADTLGLELIPLTVPRTALSDDTYLRFLDDLKAQEIGALISHVVDDSLMLAILGAGTPIICSEDTALIHPLLVSVHGLERAAIMAANYIVERLTGRGTVLVVGACDDPVLTATLRHRGFNEVATKYSGLRRINVGSGWRYEEVLEQLLEESDVWLAQVGGKIDAIFGLSDPLALAGRDACTQLGVIDEHTVVVGINGDPLAIAAIEAGAMAATIETSPQQLGFNLAEFARLAALGEPLPDHFPYTFELVTATNVGQVAARKLVFIADLPSRLVDVNRRLEEQRLVQLETSLELNQRIGMILDQDELLDSMSEIIGARYAYDRVHFYLWSNSDRMLQRMERSDAAGAAEVIPLSASGPLVHALLNNQAVYIPDAMNSHRYPPDPRWPDVRSRVVLPVRVGGRILGLLDLHSHQRVVRNQAELDSLQTLANELGAAMRNAQLYAQALQARAQAVHAGLLRSRLLAHISHQLRTPLNVILGYCQAALATPNPYGEPLPAELLQDLSYIEHSGADLERMINDLLELAQAETGALQIYPEYVELYPLLLGVFESAQRIYGENQNVRWRLQAPTSLPSVYVDPVRLRNVLMNLLSNAARHTEHGQIVLGAECSDAQTHVWVQDTGCGIAAETLAQIRQGGILGPTLSSNGAEHHFGLGLTIAHYLLQLHRGELQIESEPGQGATCHLFLPHPLMDEELDADSSTAMHRPNSKRRHTLQSQQFADKIRKFVADHYATQLTREQIAAELGVTPAYVSRVFRRHFGSSLWDYVNSYRVARACDLLTHGDLTITEVAFTVGFNDPAYFSRVFRKETGKSPLAYRTSN